jgi:hypothetical protein
MPTSIVGLANVLDVDRKHGVGYQLYRFKKMHWVITTLSIRTFERRYRAVMQPLPEEGEDDVDTRDGPGGTVRLLRCSMGATQ